MGRLTLCQKLILLIRSEFAAAREQEGPVQPISIGTREILRVDPMEEMVGAVATSY